MFESRVKNLLPALCQKKDRDVQCQEIQRAADRPRFWFTVILDRAGF